jgi:mediator of DNA damage checkpoint protein 1
MHLCYLPSSPDKFSPNPYNIFSTLVISTDHWDSGDLEIIIAGIESRGGMYKDGLTRDVTHLLVNKAAGES